MTTTRLQQLANIYNSLLRMQVSGENIMVLGDSLRALREIILQEDKELQESKENNEETISPGD